MFKILPADIERAFKMISISDIWKSVLSEIQFTAEDSYEQTCNEVKINIHSDYDNKSLGFLTQSIIDSKNRIKRMITDTQYDDDVKEAKELQYNVSNLTKFTTLETTNDIKLPDNTDLCLNLYHRLEFLILPKINECAIQRIKSKRKR